VRANALYSLAVKCGVFNMDEYRHAIERMTPQHYLMASYYERSLTSLATLCVEKGLVAREEPSTTRRWCISFGHALCTRAWQPH
jgi:nitrile hydratase